MSYLYAPKKKFLDNYDGVIQIPEFKTILFLLFEKNCFLYCLIPMGLYNYSF